MTVAGIVVYQRSGANLEGRWTHGNTGGVFAREVVDDVGVGAFEGTWQVEIFDTQGSLLWTGAVTSQPFGDVFGLSWSGTFQGTGAAATFRGLAARISEDLIASTFEQVDA